jgi:molybdopterin/thiamine biosynthesis adenylyltransferase
MMESEQKPAVRLAVVGLGGIGCALVVRIARMPFEQITLVDGDRVEAANLEKQELYAEVDIGKPKAEVAAAWIRIAPVKARIVPMDAFVDPHNVEELISMHDIVADCTDDLHVRRLIDRTCRDYGVPLVSGAVHGRQGQVITLHRPGAGEDLSLGDLFPGKAAVEQDGCDMRQVPLDVLDQVAARMAMYIRELLNGGQPMNGRIDLYEGTARAWSQIEPPRTA